MSSAVSALAASSAALTTVALVSDPITISDEVKALLGLALILGVLISVPSMLRIIFGDRK